MLYIVPTPIGNLQDITLRALETLKNVDLILAEDTRTTGALLKKYDISKPLMSYHDHNEHSILFKIINLLKSDQEIALVSDAGMPLISDPGFLLVRECQDQDIKVTVLPGASALTCALAGSGLPTDKFHFEGFMPHQKGRNKRWDFLKSYPYTIAFYESPHRIIKLLEEIKNNLGDETKVCVARELTKIYEEYILNTPSNLLEYFKSKSNIKGEFVVLVKK